MIFTDSQPLLPNGVEHARRSKTTATQTRSTFSNLTVSSLSEHSASPTEESPIGPEPDSTIGRNANGHGPDSKEKENPKVDMTIDPHVSTEKQRIASWRPFWLRKPIIAVFLVIFLGCAVTLFILRSVSDSRHGLRGIQEANTKDLGNFWRLAPAAVMTLISILWNRVELQAHRFSPWASLQRGAPYEKKLFTVDYTSMIFPMALYRGLVNKQYFVFFVTLTSAILKVQIVLSSGLFYIETLTMEQTTSIKLLDSFHITDSNLPTFNGSHSTPYYNARAVQEFKVAYPFGVAKEAAYQTFQATDSNATSRGTKESPITSVVDGFFTNVDCRLLQNYTVKYNNTIYPNVAYGSFHALRFDLQFEGCQREIQLQNSNGMLSSQNSAWRFTQKPLVGDPRPCNDLPQNHDQFIYFATLFKNATPPLEVVSVAAILCEPRSWISKVKINDDGANPKMTVLSNKDVEIVDLNVWKLLGDTIPRNEGAWDIGNMGHPLLTSSAFRGYSPRQINLSDGSYFDSRILHQAVTNITEAIGPFVAHYYLRESNEGQISGQTLERTPRLLVNQRVAIAMTILFGIVSMIVGGSAFCCETVHGAWCRNPATLLGSIIFFSRISKSAHLSLEFGGSQEGENKRGLIWSNSQHTPLTLRTGFRILFVAYNLGLVLVLIVTLQLSRRPTVLGGPVGLVAIDEGALSVWWTSLPALAMLLVALYTTSYDLALRDSAIISRLKKRSCSAKDLDTSLLDMLGVRALYHSLRLRLWCVTLCQILAILCGVLTPLSSMLFRSEIVPEVRSIPIEQQSWLGYRQDVDKANYSTLDSLLVMQYDPNIAWPDWTHSDLVFPILSLPQGTDVQLDAGDSLEVEAPAARLQPKCIRHTKAETNQNGSGRSSEMLGKPYTAFNLGVYANITCKDGSSHTYPLLQRQLNASAPTDGYLYFATATIVPHSYLIQLNCKGDGDWDSSLFKESITASYIWGRVSNQTGVADHLAYWSCDYSWSEVPTKLNLQWQKGALSIDPSRQPVTDNTKIRQLHPLFLIDDTLRYESGPDLQGGASGIEDDFKKILKPLGPFHLEAIGDADQEERMISELNRVRGVMHAQKANMLYRLGLNETSITKPFQPGTLHPVPGTITNSQRYRLVQNPGITLVLVAILLLSLIINMAALISTLLRQFIRKDHQFLLDLDQRGLVPDNFNSISILESLLLSSNTLGLMPENAWELPLSDLYESLVGINFRLGWFFDGKVGKVFTIGALGDRERPFLGAK